MFVKRCLDAARCARPRAYPCRLQDKMCKLWKDFMTFAYYACQKAVKGLQKFNDNGEKVTKNALKKLDGILMPEFYKKVAAEMQEEKTTLKSLQKLFDDIILEQWVSMHRDHPHNGQYVRPEKGVYHRRGAGSVSTWLRYTFSFSVL